MYDEANPDFDSNLYDEANPDFDSNLYDEANPDFDSNLYSYSTLDYEANPNFENLSEFCHKSGLGKKHLKKIRNINLI